MIIFTEIAFRDVLLFYVRNNFHVFAFIQLFYLSFSAFKNLIKNKIITFYCRFDLKLTDKYLFSISPKTFTIL